MPVRMPGNRLDDGNVASSMMVMSIGMRVDNLLESDVREAGSIVLCRNMVVQLDATCFDGLPHVLCAAPDAVGLRMGIKVFDCFAFVPHGELPCCTDVRAAT